MARATLEQLKTRKENALALLDTHTDEYRSWYSTTLASMKNPEPHEIANLKNQRQLMDIKADAIHTQIRYLDELIATYEVETSETAEE